MDESKTLAEQFEANRARTLTVVSDFTMALGPVTTIEMIADQDALSEMRVEFPSRSRGR